MRIVFSTSRAEAQASNSAIEIRGPHGVSMRGIPWVWLLFHLSLKNIADPLGSDSYVLQPVHSSMQAVYCERLSVIVSLSTYRLEPIEKQTVPTHFIKLQVQFIPPFCPPC